MFEFTKEQEMVRAIARECADIDIAPRVQECDRTGDIPQDIIAKMGTRGLLGLTTSKDLGGSAAGHVAMAIAVEELARVYPSVAFFLADNPGTMHIIEHFGTEEQKQGYLEPCIRGDAVLCIAATEPTGGSALTNLGTEAVAGDRAYTVNGRKLYISNGGIADYCALLVKTGDRASMLIVERGTPGYSVGRRLEQIGFKGIHVSELIFNDCAVRLGNVLGAEGGGFAVAMTAFAINRPTIGAVGLGIARGAFDIALRFAKERVLYHKPISSLQAIQFMLVDMDTAIDAAQWLIYQPGAALDRGVQPRDIFKGAARAKAAGAEVAARVVKKAMEILGGSAVSTESRLGGFLNDAMELFPAAGTGNIMKIIQAGEILKS
ncbi:MAG: acyl-CoA dehydrogenase family protein [Deltaproteobacteria bacterium]|nr:acyl-CoA dehydrogenase family protein [Deltaproteobacteria bacterium]